ncbi:hypothetical protein P3W85_26805 [Cupriavidus basilensis]|uniref:Uncharacterized protein n=1 Tax=Cupriavidus basilensis TaxID=68895 RepID=A0ABT6AV88_9BURK|nr:hypothetical protein [Cupriavidus basilensis]MDF3836536.1 hypothetical protein [Cupriavidus basilensis]
MNRKGLLDAAAVLEDLAAGRQPDRDRLAAGALALEAMHADHPSWRDMTDAAFGLHALAGGDALGLDERGRARAARLAEVVRSLVDSL